MSFVKRTLAEIAKMSLEEQENYSIEKAEFEATERKSEIEKAIVEANKNNVSKEDVAGLETQLKSAIDEIERLGLEMKKSNKGGRKVEDVSFEGAFKSAIENDEQYKSILAGGKQTAPISFETKAAVTIGLNNTVLDPDSASAITVTQNTGIVSALRKRVTTYLQNVSTAILRGTKAMWIEELDEQGNPIFIGEGDAKTQLSVRYEERDKKARKIGVFGKVTTEMLRDLGSLIPYIQNNLMRRVEIKTEDQLFSGDDTGDNLAGLVGYASAFTGGGLTTTDPTTADVFRALALQVENAFGIASAVFVRPAILAAMDVEKTADGHYLLPPFRSTNGTEVAGIRLIPSVALNTVSGIDFVGGDLSVVQVMFSDRMSIQIGMDGNDFTNNKKTILVEQELVQFVSANDTQVLVKGNIATAITAITAA